MNDAKVSDRWWFVVQCTLVVAFALLSGALRADEPTVKPSNGDALEAPNSRTGFLVYFAPLGIWLDPEVFWYRWADEQKAFLWNGSTQLPTGPDVKDSNMFIIETDAGPCLLVRKQGRWRKAGTVFGWGERIRNHGGCPTLELEG
jgi:hypothetical protein